MKLSLLMFFVLQFHLNCAFVKFSAFEVIIQVFESTKNLVDFADILNDEIDLFQTNEKKQNKLVTQTLNKINNKIFQLDGKIQALDLDTRFIKHILTKVDSLMEIKTKQFFIESKQRTIDFLYQAVKRYTDNPHKYENSTLLGTANVILSNQENSVANILYLINTELIDGNYLKLFLSYYELDNIFFCEIHKSLQQFYLEMLSKILLTNFKGFMIQHYAFLIQKLFQHAKYTQEIKDVRETFNNYNSLLLQTFNNYVSNASTELWKCNPEKHQEDKTYIQLRNVFHGFLINEENLDSEGSCSSDCSWYTYTTKLTPSNHPFYTEQKPKCPRIIHCEAISNRVDVCLTNMAKTNRRYQFLKLDHGKIYGKNEKCYSKRIVSEFWREPPFFFKCDYCWCICDEGRKSFTNRYINLRAAASDINNNKVITGIRFVEINQIIHLQVQQGELLEYGKINESTIEWVPTEDYSITDEFIKDRFGYHTIDEGQDYHVLTWEERQIELTDIIVPTNTIVTSVRFRTVGTHLTLQVQATRFNFTTGKLRQRYSYYLDDPLLNFEHKFIPKLKFESPDVPTLVTPRGSPIITTNKAVEFTYTDFVKDAGQTTVPFFDAQDVVSQTPVPLSGIGIFHKGQIGSGGFLAPRIFTYDFGPHIKTLKGKNK